jgi:hypothetical protein
LLKARVEIGGGLCLDLENFGIHSVIGGIALQIQPALLCMRNWALKRLPISRKLAGSSINGLM